MIGVQAMANKQRRTHKLGHVSASRDQFPHPSMTDAGAGVALHLVTYRQLNQYNEVITTSNDYHVTLSKSEIELLIWTLTSAYNELDMDKPARDNEFYFRASVAQTTGLLNLFKNDELLEHGFLETGQELDLTEF